MIWQRKKSLLCWFDPAASSQFHLLRSPCQRFGSPWFCLTQNLRAPLEQMLNDQFEIGCSFWFFPTCVPGSLLSCPGISRFLSKTGWTLMVFTMKRVPWNGALLFPDYCWQWATAKISKIILRNIQETRIHLELLQRATPWLPSNLWVMPRQPNDAHLSQP